MSTEQARAEMLAMADVCDRVAAQQTHGTDVSEAGAPVSAQPAAQPQRERRSLQEQAGRLADEKREIILVACSKDSTAFKAGVDGVTE